MNTAPENRLTEMGIHLPEVPTPAGLYVPVTRIDSLVMTSSISAKSGDLPRLLGQIGGDLNLDQGRESARLALLNCLAAVRSVAGSLDNISQIVRITGYVNSAPGFVDQHRVVDAASSLVKQVFGQAGDHIRSAIGVASLPLNCSVGIELIVLASPI